MDFVEYLLCNMGCFFLVGDEGLIDIECFFIYDEWCFLFLIFYSCSVGCFNLNKEMVLEVENCIDVEKDLVKYVVSNVVFLF